jgi:hypothetical protein
MNFFSIICRFILLTFVINSKLQSQMQSQTLESSLSNGYLKGATGIDILRILNINKNKTEKNKSYSDYKEADILKTKSKFF